jgi:hypothetical protein
MSEMTDRYMLVSPDSRVTNLNLDWVRFPALAVVPHDDGSVTIRAEWGNGSMAMGLRLTGDDALTLAAAIHAAVDEGAIQRASRDSSQGTPSMRVACDNS